MSQDNTRTSYCETDWRIGNGSEHQCEKRDCNKNYSGSNEDGVVCHPRYLPELVEGIREGEGYDDQEHLLPGTEPSVKIGERTVDWGGTVERLRRCGVT